MSEVKPSQFAASCFCLAARKAARALARRYDEALQPAGVNNGQFSILMFASVDPPLPLGAVAEGLGLDRTTLTAALKPLERDGYIVQRPNPADARSKLIAITRAGRRVLSEAIPLWRKAQSELKNAVTIKDADALRAALHALG